MSDQEAALLSLPDLVYGSARPNCEICFGTALVCESHPMKPWDSGTSFDCDCGAPGMPCACTGLEGSVND